MASVLIRPLITEKSMREATVGRFTFAVDIAANKNQIAQEVANTFKVKPISIQTITVKGKTKRAGRRRVETKASSWKKAIIKLSPGQKIDLFDVTEGEQKHAQKTPRHHVPKV